MPTKSSLLPVCTQQYLDHLELLPLNVHTDHPGSFVGIQIKMQGVRSCLRPCVSNKLPGEADAAGQWTLPWVERAALPGTRNCYYHLSPFHNKKETATCRIHGLHGVTEAEEAEQGLELGIVGSKA